MAIDLKLYLLELTDHKYYEGQSDDPEFRFSEHLGSKGAKWTRRYKPLRIGKIHSMAVESAKGAMLYKNWMTLQAMERYGWENSRGGDFLVLENYLLKERLEHIYDFAENKIRYYIKDKRHYLFGSSENWLIYVLQLCNGRFYIGSCKQLGKALGEHFNGNGITWTRENPVIKVLELITVAGRRELSRFEKSVVIGLYLAAWVGERFGRPDAEKGEGLAEVCIKKHAKK